MTQTQIKHLIQDRIQEDGLMDTGIAGVKLFRATQAVPCTPVIYEPSIIAIVSGAKEAVLEGARYVYDTSQYLCCPMSMPVKAGTPSASAQTPLYGVYISLNPRIMSELAVEMANVGGVSPMTNGGPLSQAIRLARWDAGFSDALLRLLQLMPDETDMAVLGDAVCARCTMRS